MKESYLTPADKVRALRSAWNVSTWIGGLLLAIVIKVVGFSHVWLLVPVAAITVVLVIIRTSSRTRL
jgi:hypothetical protein